MEAPEHIKLEWLKEARQLSVQTMLTTTLLGGGGLADWPCARAGYSGCPEPLAAGCYGPELT